MENPLDNSRLIIHLVKSKPILWNPRDSNNTNRPKIDKIWNELADEVKVSAGDLKAKWIVLRNSYARSVRQDNIDPNRPRAKWYLEDEMNFLKDFLKHRNKRLKLTNDTKDYVKEIKNEDDIVIVDKPSIDNSIQSSAPSTSSLYFNDHTEFDDNTANNEEMLTRVEDELNDSTVTSIKRSRSSYKLNEFGDNFNSSFQYQSQHYQQQQPPNSDSLFFQSIEMDFMKLPIKKKRKFKSAAMNLMNELLDETDDENGNFEQAY